MVVNEDILGGLKSALERGESLKRAMTTLFNAGYDKSEIEEAARNLTQIDLEKPIQQSPIIPSPQIPSVKSPKKSFLKNFIPEKKSAFPEQKKQIPQTAQKVSKYGGNSNEKMIIIILVISLFFLVGSLILLFLFRRELLDFFSGILS